MHRVDTVARGELEAFTTSLIAAGFVMATGDEHNWVGPIDDAFGGLTEVSQMRLELWDGWPFVHPKLFVQGLGRRRHVNNPGEVCLWGPGDQTLEWITLDGVRERIAAWCEETRALAAEPALDTHLYWGKDPSGLFTIDLSELINKRVLVRQEGRMGDLRVSRNEVGVNAGNGRDTARWYRVVAPETPPNGLEAVPAMLATNQRNDFERRVTQVVRRGGRPGPFLLWWTDRGQDALLFVQFAKGDRTGSCLEAARTDRETRLIRAGADGVALTRKRVVVFGAGAIGSHLILDLARSCVGELVIWDSERLRPGDVTRHASGSVGYPKVLALEADAKRLAPMTRILAQPHDATSPSQIRSAIAGMDAVVDATGDPNLVAQMSVLIHNEGLDTPIISIALHRQGTVARVRVQTSKGTPIFNRSSPAFPRIPALPYTEEASGFETGCAAPINNAPPWAVAAAAALGARTVIDVLMDRIDSGCDLVDVYRTGEVEGLRDPGLHEFTDGAT